MSDWQEILYAFDIPGLRTEATETIVLAVAPLCNADAVKTLLALAALTKTDAQRQGVAEALAQRLDGALAWNLVHTNRKEDRVRSVVDRAILLRIYAADSAELAKLLRRGLDEDPNLYGPLLLDAARTRPSDALRTLAGYVVWREEFTRSEKVRPELAWSRLREELEQLFGPNLPQYTQEVSPEIRDAQHLQEILDTIPEGEELPSIYHLAEEAKGKFQWVLLPYLIRWAQTNNDWTPILEATNHPEGSPFVDLARAALVEFHRKATPQDSVLAFESALRYTTEQNWPLATAYCLGVLQYQTEHSPSLELWRLAPLLRAQIARETRHSLSSRLRGHNSGTLTEQGQRFQNMLDMMERHLPDPSLPQPTGNALEAEALPRPAVGFEFEPESLPAPATAEGDSALEPKWKEWTKRFKR